MNGFCAKEFVLPRHDYEQRIRVLEEMLEFEQRYEEYIVTIESEMDRDDVFIKYYIDYGNTEENENV